MILRIKHNATIFVLDWRQSETKNQSDFKNQIEGRKYTIHSVTIPSRGYVRCILAVKKHPFNMQKQSNLVAFVHPSQCIKTKFFGQKFTTRWYSRLKFNANTQTAIEHRNNFHPVHGVS